ncbi:hypothetical protein GCM10010313_26050 [Streptomyces violarus]|nr:hypothetical protein GCM10010313_26050 [Streptomyces violarus]
MAQNTRAQLTASRAPSRQWQSPTGAVGELRSMSLKVGGRMDSVTTADGVLAPRGRKLTGF